jgi:hypothetical protein
MQKKDGPKESAIEGMALDLKNGNKKVDRKAITFCIQQLALRFFASLLQDKDGKILV